MCEPLCERQSLQEMKWGGLPFYLPFPSLPLEHTNLTFCYIKAADLYMKKKPSLIFKEIA